MDNAPQSRAAKCLAIGFTLSRGTLIMLLPFVLVVALTRPCLCDSVSFVTDPKEILTSLGFGLLPIAGWWVLLKRYGNPSSTADRGARIRAALIQAPTLVLLPIAALTVIVAVANITRGIVQAVFGV